MWWLLAAVVLISVGSASPAPLDPNNILVSGPSGVSEYTPAGTLVQTIQFGPGWRAFPDPFGTEDKRGVTVDAYGRIDLFNGVFYPFLSRFDPGSGTFEHLTHPSWRITNKTFFGKITAFQQYVFAQTLIGFIRFDLALHKSELIRSDTGVVDVSVGADGNLYVLVTGEDPNVDTGGARVDVYDPATMVLLRHIDLPTPREYDVNLVAADRFSTVFLGSLGGYIFRLTNDGAVDRQVVLGTSYLYDLAIDDNDRLIAGYGDGRIVVTDISLLNSTSFHADGTFVSFARAIPASTSPPTPQPTPIPSPTPAPVHDVYVSYGFGLWGDHYPNPQNVVREFSPEGVPVNTITFRHPLGPYFGLEELHDILVRPDSSILAFNGTFYSYLTTRSAATGAFTDLTFPGWNLLNYVGGGSLAAYNNYVFAGDLDDGGGVYGDALKPNGIVRFDTTTGSAIRFADGTNVYELNIGLDGKLYALTFDGTASIRVYDPISLQFLHQVPTPQELIDDSPLAVAADQAGNMYFGALYGAIYRLNPAGTVEASIATGYAQISDLEIDQTGRLVAVSEEGYLLTGYTTLDRQPSALRTVTGSPSQGWTPSVEFGPMHAPVPTPTPTPPTVTLSAAPTLVQKGGTATFAISLSFPAPQNITVNYAMSGNAAFGMDYTLTGTPNQVTITPGQTSATVVLTVTTLKTKGKEKATITIVNGSGYQLPTSGKKHKLKPPTASVTIRNR